MSWLAEAHREWHTVNGWDNGCPLDCYEAEARAEEAYWESLTPEEREAEARAEAEYAASLTPSERVTYYGA